MKKSNTVSYTSPHSLAGLDKHESVLLAFSGGADSVALLHLMYTDAQKKGYSLFVAHFNHKIRGEDAERDAQFCRATAEKYGLPFYLGEADVPALAKISGKSLEAEAREQRYSFFEQIMRKHGIPLLVTAHHADDNIETVLLHILRGSGTAGLGGIAPHRAFATDLHLVRPLLHIEKNQILEYCREAELPFVTDVTNDDIRYERNALRAEVIPKLKELRPSLSELITRLGENVAETEDCMKDIASRFIERECRDSRIPLIALNSVHTALRARVLSMMFEDSCGASLERVHIRSLIDLAEKGEVHSSLSLPASMRASIEDGALCFVSEEEAGKDVEYKELFREGSFSPCDGVKINIEKNPTQAKSRGLSCLDIKCSPELSDAYFRPKADGDTVCVRKINKKIKKLYNEKKIPLAERKRLPLLVLGDEILWIPGIAVCDRLKEDIINGGEDFFRISIELY